MRGIEQIPWLYDAVLTLLEALGLGAWRRALVEAVRGRTLDIGAGTGRNLPLFPRAARVVALEPDRWLLRTARRRRPDVPVILARAEALPFADHVFDTVVSGLVFCTVADPDAGLKEVHRVLKPAGELRMLEHVRSSVPWRAWVQDRLQPMWTLVAGGCHPNRDTEAAVERAGFVIEQNSRRATDEMRLFTARRAGGS